MFDIRDHGGNFGGRKKGVFGKFPIETLSPKQLINVGIYNHCLPSTQDKTAYPSCVTVEYRYSGTFIQKFMYDENGNTLYSNTNYIDLGAAINGIYPNHSGMYFITSSSPKKAYKLENGSITMQITLDANVPIYVDNDIFLSIDNMASKLKVYSISGTLLAQLYNTGTSVEIRKVAENQYLIFNISTNAGLFYLLSKQANGQYTITISAGNAYSFQAYINLINRGMGGFY